MRYSLRKMRATLAALIAAMLLSLSIPPGMARGADDESLIKIDSYGISAAEGYSAFIDWPGWKEEKRGSTVKMRIFTYEEPPIGQPDPDESTLTPIEVDVSENIYLHDFGSANRYTFKFYGIDANGVQTTEKIIVPINLTLPYPKLLTPIDKYENSRTFEVSGNALDCTDCTLILEIFSYSKGEVVSEFELQPNEWNREAKFFRKDLTVEENGRYRVAAYMKNISGDIGAQYSINTGNITVESLELQTAVNGYDLTVSWTEPKGTSYKGMGLTIKGPNEAEPSPEVSVTKGTYSYTFENLYPGQFHITAYAYNDADKVFNSDATFPNITRDGPPSVMNLKAEQGVNKSHSVGQLSWSGPVDDLYDHIRVYFKTSGDIDYDPSKYVEVKKPKFWGNTSIHEFGLPPDGTYDARVVAVDADGKQSKPVETSITFAPSTNYMIPVLDIPLNIYRNTNTFTVTGKTTYHHLTQLRVALFENGNDLKTFLVPNDWNSEDGTFSATFDLSQINQDPALDLKPYNVRAFLYSLDGNKYSDFNDAHIRWVEYEANLTTLPTGITYTVQGNDIRVDWDARVSPDYDSIELILNGITTETVTIDNPSNHHTFVDLMPGTYTIRLDALKDGYRAPAPHRSGNLVIEMPVPVLDGPAQVNTTSGIFNISGTAEFCIDCKLLVGIYNANGDLLEEIEASNWSSSNNTFSVASTTDRPIGTYHVKAKVVLGSTAGKESAVKQIKVVKSTGGSGGGGGSPAPTAPVTDPVKADAPNENETIFYLTRDASEHFGFKSIIRLAVDPLTVDQDTAVKVSRKSGKSLTLKSGYRALSDVFALSGSKSFNKSSLLTLQYDPAALNGANPERLGIFKQSETDNNVWIYVGGVVNQKENTITAPTASPGAYAVMLFDKAFQDLANHWSKKEMEILISRQLVHGVNEQSFEPQRMITRAEAVKLLVEAVMRNSNLSQLANPAASHAFTDVAADAWYYDYVKKAAAYGMVNANEDRSFRPNEPITREQFTLMLYRLAQGTDADESVLINFKDSAAISPWAKSAIAFAAQHGILQGSTDGNFRPQGHTTRAESAAIILRTMKLWGIISSADEPPFAAANVAIHDTTGKTIGSAVLTEQHNGVRIQLQVSGLTPGKHGFHVHEKAFTGLDFKTAGGHFNPVGKQHGHDNPTGHHLGDMPNLVAGADGKASVDMVLADATLSASAKNSLIGKSIIIHAAEDDYKSDPAGNAGDRIAGGIVGSDSTIIPDAADVTLFDTTGNEIGWAKLTEHEQGVRLQLKATGLTPGKHGFHIHEKAFTWLDFKTAGGHFNPEAKKHGHDNPDGSHLGDMPNLVADKDGNASLDLILEGATIAAGAKDSLIGKSIIIHAAEDDYKSDPAGNAGDRIAGGIISK